jgi:hypothetical protein
MTSLRRDNATGQGRVVETSIQNSKHGNRTHFRGQAQDSQASTHNILAEHYCCCRAGIPCILCLMWDRLIRCMKSREVGL